MSQEPGGFSAWPTGDLKSPLSGSRGWMLYGFESNLGKRIKNGDY